MRKMKINVFVAFVAMALFAMPTMGDFIDTFDTGISPDWTTATNASSVASVTTGVTTYDGIGGGMARITESGVLSKEFDTPEQGTLSVYVGHINDNSGPAYLHIYQNAATNTFFRLYFNSTSGQVYGQYRLNGSVLFNNNIGVGGSEYRYLVTANVTDDGLVVNVENTTLSASWTSDTYAGITSAERIDVGATWNTAIVFADEFNWTTQVPEPATLGLLAGMGVFVAVRKRRSK